MSTGLRRRILALQVISFAVFAFAAGFCLWGSSFVHGMIYDQLSAQQITFPAAGSPAITSLPANDATAMSQYAGQQLTNGDQAKVYADNFIAEHLSKVAGGQTYAQVSARAQANPTDTTLAGQVQTLFRGEMLRATLLNAYGWWTVGSYAFWAGIGLAVAAALVLLAFVFEAVQSRRRGEHILGEVWHRKESSVEPTPRVRVS